MLLNLFYQEPDYDRWFALDRYPRRLIRRLVRGAPKISGPRRVSLNLYAGLDQLGVKYRVNDFRHARRNPDEQICIIGGPFMVDDFHWENPIVYGAAVHSHPLGSPGLLDRLDIKKILVPGLWMENMCRPYWGDVVTTWPVGIDTDKWRPTSIETKDVDVLIYDKVRWVHEYYEDTLITPIKVLLKENGITFIVIRYGKYREDDFQKLLGRARSMIFLCEHETQGIAYQQALASGVPILAWDRGGFWQDPAYYPELVQYAPVSSVPYWDDRCGERFRGVCEFDNAWGLFWDSVKSDRYTPRDYILENLTLAKCARDYLAILEQVR